MLSRTTENVRQILLDSENFQLLCELQRDLGGFALLANNSRIFIRQGCLLKHSKRGLQQRIFFLVSLKSIATCTNRTYNIMFVISVFGCTFVRQQIISHTTVQNAWSCCIAIIDHGKL